MKNLVSIIIPCRNEEKFIARCLDSVLANDYPKDNLEIFVIDGDSQDKTKEIIKSYAEKLPYIKLLENPKKYTPVALNLGIKQSKGNIIIRLDSHATYEKNYISKCVEHLEKYNADNVGGIIKTMSANNNLFAKSIAICMSSFFGTGNSHFRTGTEKIMEVDTVFGGCYKKEVFDKIGLFNEKLIRSQDMEFNIRLKKSGGKIILVPDIVSYYYPKDNLPDFLKHNFEDGIWSVLPIKLAKTKFKARHYAFSFFVGLLIILFLLRLSFLFWAVLGLYFLASIYFSFKIVKNEKDIKYLFSMPIVYAVRHFAYGFGGIVGLFKLLLI